MNWFKRINIAYTRGQAKMFPGRMGRFYGRSADRMEQNFWREYSKWIVVGIVYNVAFYLFLKELERRQDEKFQAELDKILRQPVQFVS